MTDEIKKFEAAVRKTMRMIAALDTIAVDETTNARELTAPITKAFNRLWDLSNRAGYGDANDARSAEISRIIGMTHDAGERLQARIVTARCAAMKEFSIERARLANARGY
jgi:hypothetical protein